MSLRSGLPEEAQGADFGQSPAHLGGETCAREGERGEGAITPLCLLNRTRLRNKRVAAPVPIVDAPISKKKKVSWVWNIMQVLSPPIQGKTVCCAAEVTKFGNNQPCSALFKWSGSSGTSTLANHIERAHPNLYLKHKLAGASPMKAREEKEEVLTVIKGGLDEASNATGQKEQQEQPKGAGKPIPSYLQLKLKDNVRAIADRRFVAWSAVNFRAPNMLQDIGFKLFVGMFAPDYVSSEMTAEAFDDILRVLYAEVREKVLAEIREHQQSCLALGYRGPFLSGQLDLVTVDGEDYITFSVSYIPSGEVSIKRFGLATRAFPSMHTASDVQYWLQQVIDEWFAELMGECVEAQKIFLAFTVGKGDNIVNAINALGIPVIRCNAHRLNSVVCWMPGIAGSGKSSRNAVMERLVKKLSACVEEFSYSPVKRSELEVLQELITVFSKVYELVKRNQTRWTAQRNMMERVLQYKEPIVEYFKQHPAKKNGLVNRDWAVTNEICSTLDPIADVEIKIQGPGTTYISEATFLMKELVEIMRSEHVRIRVPDIPGVNPVPYEQMNKNELFMEVLSALDVFDQFMGKKGLGMAKNSIERISVFLDPRRIGMSEDDCIDGCEALQAMAVSDIGLVGRHFYGDVAQSSCAASTATSNPAAAPMPTHEPSLSHAPTPVHTPTPAPRSSISAAALPRVPSIMEQRRLARLAVGQTEGNAQGVRNEASKRVTHRSAFKQELARYLVREVKADVCGFSLPKFWLSKSVRTLAYGTNEVVSSDLPHLALVARLYHGVEATSCQAERNFSSVSFLIANLRLSTSPINLERMMFLRLNQSYIPEVEQYNAAIATQQEMLRKCE